MGGLVRKSVYRILCRVWKFRSFTSCMFLYSWSIFLNFIYTNKYNYISLKNYFVLNSLFTFINYFVHIVWKVNNTFVEVQQLKVSSLLVFIIMLIRIIYNSIFISMYNIIDYNTDWILGSSMVGLYKI